MEDAMTGSHFCPYCRRIGNPIMEFEIVCPFCQSRFIEELEYTARDYDDNDNNYYNGKLRAICLDGQLVNFLYWNRRCFPKDDAFLDLVLPGRKHEHGPDSVCTASKQAEADLYSPRCYPEQVELPEADMLISSTDQTSPPCSPSNSDFTPSTPSAWEFGDVEFQIKEEEEEEEEEDI